MREKKNLGVFRVVEIMASNDVLLETYEKWLKEKLVAIVGDPNAVDLSIVVNFILSTISDDETSMDDKCESIRPFLQELNQVEKKRNRISTRQNQRMRIN